MCCGQNRAAARAAAQAAGAARANSAPAPVSGAESSVIVFESVQDGARVVRGPVSGRLYRFAGAGDRVRVDARDRPGLTTVPGLRWVR